MKRLWPWMYHFSLELRQKVSSERKFQRPGSHVDLFATSLNHKLETFVSPVPDPLSFAVDAMSWSCNLIAWSWEALEEESGMEERRKRTFRPKRETWRLLRRTEGLELELLLLSCARPLKLPFRRDLLSQFKGKVVHPRPESLHLHAWLLSGRGKCIHFAQNQVHQVKK
jgi:hypothetical protein